MTREEKERNLVDIILQLDPTEQLIIMAGMVGLKSAALNLNTYEAWVDERVKRHRAGDKLRVSDLELPPHPADA